MDIEIENEILMHYGVKRRSGRFPWGSGDAQAHFPARLPGHGDAAERDN